MDAGIAAIGGALVGAIATLGTAALTTRAQRQAALTTVRADYQKEVREPRRVAFRQMISAATDMAEYGAGDVIWSSSEALTNALDLKEPIDEGWLEITLLGPAEVLTEAAELRKWAYALFGHLVSVRVFINAPAGEAEMEERRINGLVSQLDDASIDLMDSVLALSRAAQRALEYTGLERI